MPVTASVTETALGRLLFFVMIIIIVAVGCFVDLQVWITLHQTFTTKVIKSWVDVCALCVASVALAMVTISANVLVVHP